MSIRFLCTACGKKLKADSEYAGVRVQCTGCGAVQVVPGTPTPTPAPTPTPPAAPEHEEEAPLAFSNKLHDDEELIDMTAMVDITFFLLIFFMITSVHHLLATISMPTPEAEEGQSHSQATPESRPDEGIVVRIDADNTIWVDDVVAPTRQELLFKLREARDSFGVEGASMTVIASPDAFHKTVVMALDAGTKAGLEDVRLATGGEEDE